MIDECLSTLMQRALKLHRPGSRKSTTMSSTLSQIQVASVPRSSRLIAVLGARSHGSPHPPVPLDNDPNHPPTPTAYRFPPLLFLKTR